MTLLSSARLIPVQQENLGMFWPEVRGWVSQAADVTKVKTADDWLDDIDRKKAQLWVISRDGHAVGAIVTEVYETAAGLTVGLPIAAGEMCDVETTLATIEAWAKEVGAVRLEGCGRPGWERALAPLGWSKIATTIEKVLA